MANNDIQGFMAFLKAKHPALFSLVIADIKKGSRLAGLGLSFEDVVSSVEKYAPKLVEKVTELQDIKARIEAMRGKKTTQAKTTTSTNTGTKTGKVSKKQKQKIEKSTDNSTKDILMYSFYGLSIAALLKGMVFNSKRGAQ